MTQELNNVQRMEESFVEKQFERDADKYERKYSDYIDECAKAMDEAYGDNKRWSIYDTVTLGQYLESWDTYREIFEQDPTSRDELGDYLKVGLGLAAVQYVTMPASFIATVQPMQDEVGVIYYRQLIATKSRGNVSDGDVIGNTSGAMNHELDEYYGEAQSTELAIASNIDSGTGAITTTLNNPVRPQTIKVTVEQDGTTYNGIDDGDGNVYGNWPTQAGAATGSINYSTGALEINLNDASTDGTVTVTYEQNIAQSDEIPGFLYKLVSKPVRATYFILANQYSTLADYTVRRRFGRAMSDDISTAAITQINAAALSSMIKKLDTAATNTGTVNWDAAPTDYVSVAEHRKTFPDAMESAAENMAAATDRGAISFMIAGSYTRRVLGTLGVNLTRKPLPGPYLAGFFQGLPVYYAPRDLVAQDECIVGYRGTSWFEAPIAYAPFLPVVSVRGMSGSNPFNRVTGVAHSAAVDTLIEGFSSKIKITNMS